MFCLTVPHTRSVDTHVWRLLTTHCSVFCSLPYERLKLSRTCWTIRCVTSVMEWTVGAAMLRTSAATSTAWDTTVSTAGPQCMLLQAHRTTDVSSRRMETDHGPSISSRHSHVWCPRLLCWLQQQAAGTKSLFPPPSPLPPNSPSCVRGLAISTRPNLRQELILLYIHIRFLYNQSIILWVCFRHNITIFVFFAPNPSPNPSSTKRIYSCTNTSNYAWLFILC